MSTIVTFPGSFRLHAVSPDDAAMARQRMLVQIVNANDCLASAVSDVAMALTTVASGDPLPSRGAIESGDTLISVLQAALALIDVTGAANAALPIRRAICAHLEEYAADDFA